MRTHVFGCTQLAVLLVLTPPILTSQAVHPGKTVRFTAPSVLHGRLEGVYLGRSGDTVFFGNDERGPIEVPSLAISALDVSMGKSRWRGALRGMLWGAAVAAPLGALAIADTAWDTQADGSKASFVVTSVLSGAFIGGIVGLFVPARVWRRADPRVLMDATSTWKAGGASDNQPLPVVSEPVPVVQANAPPRNGATAVVEATVGFTGPAPYADFPTLVASLAVNLGRKPRYGAALVGDFDASYLRLGLMAGPRIYGRSGPLSGGPMTLTYFGQFLAGTVIGGVSGVIRTSGGFGMLPGAGLDFGLSQVAARAQIDYRIVPGGYMDDERIPGRHVSGLSGLRVVVGSTVRFPLR